MHDLTRRTLLRQGALGAGTAAVALTPGASALAQRRPRIGRVLRNDARLLDLPRGFRYRVVQRAEEDRLTRGAIVPGDFDGMAAFPGRQRGTTVLVRNHELDPVVDPFTKAPVQGRRPYQADAPGGTTAVVVGRDLRPIRSYVTSSGTLANCAGGATPWGTWITCEETLVNDHGYCYEVDPYEPDSALARRPIRDMGFFAHESVDVDPRTGIVYLTEDDLPRGSFLFRYLPTSRAQRPGELHRGGRLQAMAVDQRPGYDLDLGRTRERFQVTWVDVNPARAHDDALAGGAARFNRLEGSWFAGGAFWFDDTFGGDQRTGSVYRLFPSGRADGSGTDRLELFLEGNTVADMESPDNLCVTPWGDVWFTEDGPGFQRIMGITPSGGVYEFARNRVTGTEAGTASELCGCCFSPDGRTFFVNVQNPGHTFAVFGRFPRRNPRRQRALAASAPAHPWSPEITPDLAERATKDGGSAYETAAFARLGVPVV